MKWPTFFTQNRPKTRFRALGWQNFCQSCKVAEKFYAGRKISPLGGGGGQIPPLGRPTPTLVGGGGRTPKSRGFKHRMFPSFHLKGYCFRWRENLPPKRETPSSSHRRLPWTSPVCKMLHNHSNTHNHSNGSQPKIQPCCGPDQHKGGAAASKDRHIYTADPYIHHWCHCHVASKQHVILSECSDAMMCRAQQKTCKVPPPKRNNPLTDTAWGGGG